LQNDYEGDADMDHLSILTKIHVTTEGDGGPGQANVTINKNNATTGGNSQAFLSGFGGYHTEKPTAKNPRPYVTMTLEQIREMMENPESVAKDQAQWAIFSTTVDQWARGHEYQRENGTFYGLWADIDDVEGMTFQDVLKRTKAALPGIEAWIYSSRDATENKPKSRLIVPLAEGIPGRDYPMIAKILNDRMKKAGLLPDRVTERAGQLCYLPNRGEFYRHHIIEGEILNPAVHFADEIQAETEQLKREAAEREARHLVALRKTQARIDTGHENPVTAFKAAYPLELALERYGYTKRGNKWLSPQSESGNSGVSVKDGKWHSHHAGDAGIGQAAKGGGTWGDAFDLFVFYEHGGNYHAALKAAGEMFYRTDPETGERVTITLFNQRQYMRDRGTGAAPADDFQGTITANQGEQNGPAPWESIIPLDAMEVDRIDPDTLPGIIGEYAGAVARETETPLELAAGMLFVVIAAYLHSGIIGRYPWFNISSRLTEPTIERLKDFGEAFRHEYWRCHQPHIYQQHEVAGKRQKIKRKLILEGGMQTMINVPRRIEKSEKIYNQVVAGPSSPFFARTQYANGNLEIITDTQI
jgi:hypothetical protein